MSPGFMKISLITSFINFATLSNVNAMSLAELKANPQHSWCFIYQYPPEVFQGIYRATFEDYIIRWELFDINDYQLKRSWNGPLVLRGDEVTFPDYGLARVFELHLSGDGNQLDFVGTYPGRWVGVTFHAMACPTGGAIPDGLMKTTKRGQSVPGSETQSVPPSSTANVSR